MSRTLTPAPLQLYHLVLDGGRCATFEPHVELRSHVHFYWSMRIDAPRVELRIIPDAATDLVLSPDLPRFAAVFPPRSTSLTLELAGPVRYVGASFRPAGVAMLLKSGPGFLRKLEAGERAAEALSLGTLIDGLQGQPSDETVRERFDEWFLAARADAGHERARPARESHSLYTLVHETVARAGLDSVCRTLGISERQCRRRSHELLGLSPKKLQRVLRLQAALRELVDVDPALGLDLYHDDSHRIRELKALAGLTPGEIRRLAETYNTGATTGRRVDRS